MFPHFPSRFQAITVCTARLYIRGPLLSTDKCLLSFRVTKCLRLSSEAGWIHIRDPVRPLTSGEALIAGGCEHVSGHPPEAWLQTGNECLRSRVEQRAIASFFSLLAFFIEKKNIGKKELSSISNKKVLSYQRREPRLDGKIGHSRR